MPFNQTGLNAQANINTYIDVTQTNYTTNQTTETGESRKLTKDRLIESLPRAQASRKDYQLSKKSGPCFEGTRVAIVRDMIDWVTIPGESRIYALSGLAGIRKSTIAYTVAAQADYRGLLGASFFFSRDDFDCRTAKKFFTTLAYQLYRYNEEFAKAIGDVLISEHRSVANMTTPQEQLEALILKPLRGTAASKGRPVLIVVDALDECDADDAPFVLAGLREMVQDLPSFKIILTTRPQPLVGDDLATLRNHKIFHLQDIEEKVVNNDIRLYLKHSFSPEQVKMHLQDSTQQWYASNAEIESLVQAVGKLFIIASTAVAFILDRTMSDPQGRMSKLLSAFAQDRTPFKPLNNFYSVILRNAVPDDCEDDVVERYQSVVGAIVVINIPLPITALAQLISRREEEINGALRHLQSVILVGSDRTPVIYHKSFTDFVTDPARCQEINLRIDPMMHHTRIAIQCFILMDRQLRYNILDLDTPARFMNNEDGLTHQGISDGQLQEKIPSELRYACIYWAHHLEGANTNDADLMKELEKFSYNHMLHWLEALGFIGELDSGHLSIRVALKLVKPTSSDLFQLLSDGLRFISKFYDLIERATLHMYYSALPFTPTKSLLYLQYSKEAMNSICRVRNEQEKWDPLLAMPYFEDKRAADIKFSHDSATFATWGNGENMKLWDADTGTRIPTIRLNAGPVAIANDFSTLASASDNIITLYGVKNSASLATFTTWTEVSDLALSSESSRIAALLSDGTVCLLDTEKTEPIACFGGFDTEVHILTFSLTGARLVGLAHTPLGSGIIQLRNGITGTLIVNIGNPSVSEVCHGLVFSHDGSRFAILTEADLILWESENGQLVGVATDALNVDHEVGQLAISANGSLLATGYDFQVQIWSGNSGYSLALIDGLDLTPHNTSDIDIELMRNTISLAFALDDILAFGTAVDITIYDVKNHSVILALSFVPVFSLSLAFSPDCTRLAAMRSDSMYLWDLQNIKVSSSSLRRKSERVRDLVFSQDCARLACVSEDNTIELWEIGLAERKVPIYDGRDKDRVSSIAFDPDGKNFAAGFNDGTIRLWDSKDGALIEAIKYFEPSGYYHGPRVALSSSLLAGGGSDDLALWDLQTLLLIGNVEHFEPSYLTFSSNGGLLAFSNCIDYIPPKSPDNRNTVTVLDVMTCTAIAIFDIYDSIRQMTFLPDDSQLVVQFYYDGILLFHLVSNEVIYEPTFNSLVQLRHLPLWHGIPLWLRGRSLLGLFPQYEDPVPVLWFLQDAGEKVQGSSMIALANVDGQVALVQSSSSCNAFD